MSVNVNLNGVDTLLLNFDGTTTAALTAPATTTISHTSPTTGITELTGDVTAGPGTGSQVATLSNTSTARSHLGLGTMATQNSNAVAITGGTIDGTPIGSTTPSTVAATTLSLPSGSRITYDGGTSRIAIVGGTSGGEVLNHASTATILSWDDSGNTSVAGVVTTPSVHSATINLDDTTLNYPANSTNIHGSAGTLYVDSTGSNASTFGAFSFRGIKAGNPGGTGFTTFLSSDSVGNWTATKSIALASGGGGAITFQDGTTQSTAAVSPTLQTNGTNNTVQNKLNLKAGTNVTLTADGSGGVTIASSSGGSGFPNVVYSDTSDTVQTANFIHTTGSLTGMFRVSVGLLVQGVGGSGSATCTGSVSYTSYAGAMTTTVMAKTAQSGAGYEDASGTHVFYSDGGTVTITVSAGGSSGTSAEYYLNSITLEQLA